MFSRITKAILLYWLAGIHFCQAYAIYPVFSHIDRKQGLSHPHINAIVKDAQGFMWFATEDGLNRYDGYEIKVYRYKAGDPNSVNDNHITTLLLDSRGRLWVGTLRGVSRYIPGQDNFIRYPSIYNTAARVFSLYENTQKEVLVGTNGDGIMRAVDDTLSLESPRELDFMQIKSRKIKVLSEFERTYVVGTDDGLFVIEPDQKVLKDYHFSYSGGDDLFSNDIYAIHKKGPYELLIGSGDGLHVLNLQTQQYYTVSKVMLDGSQTSHKVIRTIADMGKGILWLGTDDGIRVTDREITQSSSVRSNQEDPRSLNANSVTSVFKDDTGLVWIGTKNSGINLYNPNVQAFGLRKFANDSHGCVASNVHFNIIKSSETDIWLDAYQQGLYRLNLTSGACFQYEGIAQELYLKNDVINAGSLFEHSQGDIWFGTLKGAIYRLKKGQHTFERFVGKNEAQLRPGALRAVVEDYKGNLWMAFDYGGLRYLDYETEHYQAFYYDENDQNTLSSNFIFALALDEKRKALWIGSETGGVDKYELDTQRFIRYWHSEKRVDGFKSGVYSLIYDERGDVWAGTMGSGLARISEKSSEVRYFTTDNGLPNDTIYKVLKDNQGILWLATNKGLARFDPETHVVHNYYASDGLQGNEFNTGGFFDLLSGEVLLVGSQGVNIFSPPNIKLDQSKARTVITQLLLFNRPQNALLKTDDEYQTYLNLEYHQNLFSFAFSGLHYADPQRQHYQYKLEGFDLHWRTTDYKLRTATYTNLDPGEYLFRVKSSNHHGVWGDETQVRVTIFPPMWLTWWAKLSYLIVAVVVAVAAYRFRTRSMRAQNRELELRVASRTHELKQEKQRVEALLQHKSKEFENISHEFRTPLAIIIGRAQQQLQQTISPEQRAAFDVIAVTGQRLAQTVDDVIALAKFQQQEPQHCFRLVSVSTLIRDICERMSCYAMLKQQQFSTFIDSDIFHYCQPYAIEKLVNNLLSNAIKYTPEYGRVTVVLRQLGEKYQLTVSDNGVGIAKAQQEMIFKRFYRCDDSSLIAQGSGIGLSLVSDVVNLHDGEIELHSESGKGSQFTVTFCSAPQRAEEHDYVIDPKSIELMMLEQQINEQHTDTWSDSALLPSLLVVEDNLQLNALLREQLEGRYQVLCAFNGVDGLSMAINQVPDFIISDINMPKMDGYQLLDKVKNNPATSHIPVLLLTAQCDAESRLTGFKYKADAYVAKPYRQDELLAIIEAQHFNRQKVREHIGCLLANDRPLSEAGLDEYSNEVIDKCVTYITEHYQEASLSVKTLLDIACLSERQLQRKFQETLGMTPGEFIKEHRLNCAQPLLRKAIKVNDVAHRVGFSSANHFSRQYRDKFGYPPSQEAKRSA
ncbi:MULTISPECIES: hybrid sensor histidine kinase/response regulator transcription factor [unclassified Pseudoalteromonas]|uniref:hybrid sensor histidine kinase/response regulator transcription factor n=1 Tax=unclassified Pseudoalteromonas TaxID=194690 RepID=UPI002097648F|nr:hybrid sensor histidine kinase/response regulator transcription factor [Pseudoalteromonas sp. XMcav2-N]MCO7187863.1 ATP-binding protein [Pseudoalteromonas sp. XMcav2-N]